MLRIAVPSVLQQSTVSIGMMIVQAVVNPFGTQALAGYTATMRVENVFSLIFVSIGNAVSPYVSQNLGAKKIDRIKKGYHAALVLDLCFAVLAFLVIETLHTQISSLFLGKDGTALAYQVSGDYMRWIGYFFIFMGIKMATDGVLRGLGIMRPFLVANMVNLAIRLSVALICAPRFGIAFVWLAVPAGWLANFLISYGALRRSWPTDKMASICTEANMKQTPQIRLVLRSQSATVQILSGTRSRVALAFRPRGHARRRPGKGRCSTAVRRFVSRMSKCCPALQFSRRKRRLTRRCGTHTGAQNCRKWTAELWMSRCSSLSKCCAGKRRRFAAYVRNTICMPI